MTEVSKTLGEAAGSSSAKFGGDRSREGTTLARARCIRGSRASFRGPDSTVCAYGLSPSNHHLAHTRRDEPRSCAVKTPPRARSARKHEPGQARANSALRVPLPASKGNSRCGDSCTLQDIARSSHPSTTYGPCPPVQRSSMVPQSRSTSSFASLCCTC